LTLWLFLILFAGAGVYKLLGRIGKPIWADWLLLPGTIVSEMAFIFGCLITGGEIRRAKLITTDHQLGPKMVKGSESVPRLKIVGPIVSAMSAIIGCMAVLVLVHNLLDSPVISDFVGHTLVPPGPEAALPKDLPTSWDRFWGDITDQVLLLRRMGATLGQADWLNWRVLLFVYLTLCLSVRLAPVSRPMRPTLAAGIVVAALIALIGAVSETFSDLVHDVWPLLTYVWASLLMMLCLVLLVEGLARLIRVLQGKHPA
jgi:hypothetical protein